MRILSQDGLHEGIIDVPYEQICIEQKENEIWCGYSSTMDRNCIGKCFAKYSTAEKARKAMEMLHHMYTYGEEVELPEIDEKQFAEDDDIGLSNAIFYNKNRFFRVSKKYFQFPSDDELEV